MSYEKPFYRNYRAMIQGHNSGYSDWAYIVDQNYAVAREHYTRAFKVIQLDLIKCFEYIEPSDVNVNSFSLRTHELLMRACMEVETNFKAILKENIFNPVYNSGTKAGQSRPEKSWNMLDYKKINQTHRLSSYTVHIPIWSGEYGVIRPFEGWDNDNSLDWYQAYNKSKHDRHNEFHNANFINMVKAVSGLLVLLSSQFRTESFTPGEGSSLGCMDFPYFIRQPVIPKSTLPQI